MNQDKIWTKDFLYLCFSNFLVALMFYMLATVLPLFVQTKMIGNEKQMGLVITVYMFGSVLARIFSGVWVDRFGKKKISIIGFTLFFIATISYFGIINGIVLLLIIRFIHGISFAIASTGSTAAVISILPLSRRGEGIGYSSMFISLSMVVGPWLGLLLWQSENIYILLTAVTILSAIALFLVSCVQINESDINIKNKQKKLHWSDILEIKALPISLISFFLLFSYSSLAGFLASYTEELNQASITGLFFIVFAIMIVAFRPIVAKLLDKCKEQYLFYPSILLFAIGMFILSQAHSASIILISSVFMGLSYGILYPLFQGLSIKQSPINRSGAATATFFLLNDIGYGLGSYFMGVTASISNYRTMYIVAGIIALSSAIAYFTIQLFSNKNRESTS